MFASRTAWKGMSNTMLRRPKALKSLAPRQLFPPDVGDGALSDHVLSTTLRHRFYSAASVSAFQTLTDRSGWQFHVTLDDGFLLDEAAGKPSTTSTPLHEDTVMGFGMLAENPCATYTVTQDGKTVLAVRAGITQEYDEEGMKQLDGHLREVIRSIEPSPRCVDIMCDKIQAAFMKATTISPSSTTSSR